MSHFSIVNEILPMLDFFLYNVIFPVLHYFFSVTIICECKINQLKVLILKVFSFLCDKFIYHIWSQKGEGPITLLQRAHQNTGNLMTTVQFLIVIFIIILSKYFLIFDWLKIPQLIFHGQQPLTKCGRCLLISSKKNYC